MKKQTTECTCRYCGAPTSEFSGMCLDCRYRDGAKLTEREHCEDTVTHMHRSLVVRLSELHNWVTHA